MWSMLRLSEMIQYTCVFRSNRIQVLERDGFACQICHNMNGLEVHHKIPLRLNGSDSMDNLLTLCKSCHVIEESKLKPPVEPVPKKLSGSMWPIHCNMCEFVWWSSYYPKSCQRCKSVNWNKHVSNIAITIHSNR